MPNSSVMVPYGLLIASVVAPTAVTIPPGVQMLVQTCLIIFIASYNAAERERKRKGDGDRADPRDVISGDQAYRFPIVASCALFGMFLAFKYLPKDWVSFLLTLYGIGFGAMAFSNVLSPIVESLPGIPVLFKKEIGLKNYFTFNLCDIIAAICASPVAYWYYQTKSWLPNNILGCSLALSAVDMLALGDFKSGAVLLSGLFVYDIFWVFGSKSVFGANVMVSVAKQFEGPIKLVFPRFVGATGNDFSMLGLGDIVIPGLFVALMLRFDIRKVSITDPIPSKLPYFYGAMFAYALGLVATLVALSVFNAAQPALLYLVPACLLCAVGIAASRGEMKELWTYTEADEEPDADKQKSKDAGNGEAIATEVKKDK